MAMLKNIEVRGAREHNLKGVDVDLPRDKLIVITGLSGSGKSSLAFDTIYAEGQRRYVPALHSRHCDGNLRLYAPALGACGHSLFPRNRPTH